MALGGDSLAAEEMLAIVQERFGVALVSTDVVEAPTLREFTRRVMLGSASLPSHPDVVTLRSEGTDTPMFCFAGSGALALTFVPLSRHIPNRPVYAFQARGLEKRAMPDWTVESTARRYLEIIRIVQPRGPYILIGHSFGGLVALEIARVLTDAGETVDFVGLLDTYLPRSSGKQPTMNFEPMVERPSAATAVDKARDFAQAQVHRVLPDGLPALRQWNRQARAYLAGVVPFSGQRQFDAFFDHGAITSRRYHLRPYAGRTMLVLADNNPDGPDAWRALLTGPHEFVNLACEHSSLLRDPHAATLATILNAELDGLKP
jgi:thioesterase domain-containing protein